jgi:hypothetical protein
MRQLVIVLCASSVAATAITSAHAAEVDARPPDRLLITANGSRLSPTDDGDGRGGSLNWLHYFTPDAVFGLGAEHQFIGESSWTFGSVRGSITRGEAPSKFGAYAEFHYGEGDDDGRDFDYQVGVLGFSQSFGKFTMVLEGREIDIDTSQGTLPKLALSYLWTPRLLTTVSYADSVGGNLGTELTTARLDYYGRYMSFLLGGATGRADPSVINIQGVALPAQDLKQGFLGIGRTFSRGEIQLLGDFLELGDNEKVTITVLFTAYLGSRGRTP